MDGKMEAGQVDYYQMFNGTLMPDNMTQRIPTDSLTLITQNRILQAALDDPRVKLTEKQRTQINDYMLYTDSQILKILKERSRWSRFFNDDPELRFAPTSIKFLKDRGVTGKEPPPFKL